MRKVVIIDFAQAVEPLLKTTVPHVISAFDELEQKGLLGLVTKFPTKVDLSQAQEVGLSGMLWRRCGKRKSDRAWAFFYN
jgi:hypothetical protein